MFQISNIWRMLHVQKMQSIVQYIPIITELSKFSEAVQFTLEETICIRSKTLNPKFLK